MRVGHLILFCFIIKLGQTAQISDYYQFIFFFLHLFLYLQDSCKADMLFSESKHLSLHSSRALNTDSDQT